MILETVLKASGLVEGSNYLRQGSARDEAGRMHRPDIVILLPGRTPGGRGLQGQPGGVGGERTNRGRFRLRGRDAAARVGHSASTCVIFPTRLSEAARVRSARPHRHVCAHRRRDGGGAGAQSGTADRSFQRKIVLASPNTLMAMLTVVERMLDARQAAEAGRPDRRGCRKVLDAVTAFLDDFDKLGTHLQRAGDAFTASQRRLRDSDQSVVARTAAWWEQGAKGKKLLLEELQPTSPSGALPLLLEEPADEQKLI
jgi:DNA recombination protein RmuC